MILYGFSRLDKKEEKTINPKNTDENAFNMQQLLHQIMKKLIGIQKEFHILHRL